MDPDTSAALAEWTAAGIAFLALGGSVVGYLLNRRQVSAAKADAAEALKIAERSAAAAERSAAAAHASAATAAERAAREQLVELASRVRWEVVTAADGGYILLNIGTAKAENVEVLRPATLPDQPAGDVSIAPQKAATVKPGGTGTGEAREVWVAWRGHEAAIPVPVPPDPRLYVL